MALDPPEAARPAQYGLHDDDDDDDPPTRVAFRFDMSGMTSTSAASIPPPVAEDTTTEDPTTHNRDVPGSAAPPAAAPRSAAPPAAVPQGVPREAPRGEIELLHGAPAAVPAAALQVMEAHRRQSDRRPPRPPPSAAGASRPPPPPSRAATRAAPVSKAESSPPHQGAAAMERRASDRSPPSPAPGIPTTLETGTRINDRYTIEDLIGHGGMGTVYAVRHVNTDEKLALKLLHPALADNDAAIRRFRTEARAPVQIDSEHVVRVVDADVAAALGGVPYLVMERLKGHDLRSDLKRRGALPAGEVVLYLRQVARALDKAHALGIIHRDLKPANLYVQRREDGSPLVKVLDFGIAKLTDDAAKELTVAGQVFGTPWYMAPEQARGDLGSVGPRTDLWALGLIAFQLLTGQNYWTADSMAGLVGQICYEPMPPPSQRAPHLGPRFDHWFAHACHREPSQRYPTARDMVTALAVALGVDQTAGTTTGGGAARPLAATGGPWGSGTRDPRPSSLDHNSAGYVVPREPSASYPIPGTSLHGDLDAGRGGSSGSSPSRSAPSRSGPPGFEGTNAPLYTTRMPEGRRRRMNRGLPVVLGIVIAVLVVATSAGVYLSLPNSAEPPPSAASREAPTAGVPSPPEESLPARANADPRDPEPPRPDASGASPDEPPTETSPSEGGDDPAPASPSAAPSPPAPPPAPVAVSPRPRPAPTPKPPPRRPSPSPAPAPK
ncbi:MAG: serine/threonine-protein kinase, partial [Myxococcota bacterium]